MVFDLSQALLSFSLVRVFLVYISLNVLMPTVLHAAIFPYDVLKNYESKTSNSSLPAVANSSSCVLQLHVNFGLQFLNALELIFQITFILFENSFRVSALFYLILFLSSSGLNSYSIIFPSKCYLSTLSYDSFG